MSRIPDDVIEQIKRTTDLVSLIKNRGIKLRKHGKVYKGCCPFHDEKTASFTVTPAKGLWHCFGCDQGGDAIRFVELVDQVSFREAVNSLKDNTPKKTQPTKDNKKSKAASSLTAEITPTKRTQLLSRVVKFYHQRFLDQPEGIAYLTKQRGINNVSLFKNYQIGLSDGSLLDALPQDDESLNLFKALGVLTEKGRELFNGCVVFPLFDDQGNVVNLYGRRIKSSSVNHLYLPGLKVGLWNYQAAKRSTSLLVTESVIDALTLIDRGLHDVMPCYGVHGLTDDLLNHFETNNIKELTLCFDGDEAGKKGVKKTGKQLKEKNINVNVIELPDAEDINSYLNRYDISDFQNLLSAVNPENNHQTETQKQTAANIPKLQKTDQGFILTISYRIYEIKAIARQGTQLKTTIKASVKDKNGFELHTLDLYSARSREAFARSCLSLFDEDEQRIKNDLTEVLDCVENHQPDDSNKKDKTPESSTEAKAAAVKFLKQKNIVKALQDDLTILGVAGEDLNKVLCYLAATSRKLDDPLSLLIQSRSAAGKSTLQNAILDLIPIEEKVVLTRLTDQALFYQDEYALVHKVLAIEEAEGLGGAAYSLRALQSAKSVSVATTSKDPITGKMKTEHYTVHGPVAVLLTTTQADLDEETRSRFLTLTIDESEAMTERIFKSQRQNDTLEGYLNQLDKSTIIEKHHAVQRMLEPLAVINPYAKQLAFPCHSLRTRRDNKKYLQLIKSVTYLHQQQRPIKEVKRGDKVLRYIEVTKADIKQANALAHHVLAHSLDELSAPARNLLKQIHTMVKNHCKQKKISPSDFVFTRKTIRDHTGWSDWQIRTHMAELNDLEYLKSRAGAWGKEYIYELIYDGEGEDGKRFCLNLTDPKTLVDEVEPRATS